jgi:hypothetical protein
MAFQRLDAEFISIFIKNSSTKPLAHGL